MTTKGPSANVSTDARDIEDDVRDKVLRAAERWIGTAYDYTHGDFAWQDLDQSPQSIDCSSFVCRIAMEALEYPLGLLAPDALWLLDNLMEIDTPAPGDIVGYGRAGNNTETALGRDIVWHVMVYLGDGKVIGTCDIAGTVTVRALEYEDALAHKKWRLIDAPAYRSLNLRRTG